MNLKVMKIRPGRVMLVICGRKTDHVKYTFCLCLRSVYYMAISVDIISDYNDKRVREAIHINRCINQIKDSFSYCYQLEVDR